MYILLFKLFTIVSIVNFTCGQQFVGESCIGRAQVRGICRTIGNCPQVRTELSRGIRPITCGYENLQAIVCCPTVTAPIATTFTEEQKQTKRYRKCDEYKSAVFEKSFVLQLVANAKPLEKETDQCGHQAVPLIIGGTRAGLKEFPHSALLGYQTFENTIKWGCGGSLISKRYVLTAAHCINSQDYGPVARVRLGDLDITSDDDHAAPKDFDVADRITHPDYGRTKYNDIALLRMKEQITLSPHIRPLCLPITPDVPKKGIATGWGAVEWAGSSSSTLLKVTLETYSQVECNASYTQVRDRKLPRGIENTQFCAGSRTEAKDTCQGDSGGPFQIYHPTMYCMYMQVGVTSFGRACGGINTPGVYTNVGRYVDWIENIVWPDGQTNE